MRKILTLCLALLFTFTTIGKESERDDVEAETSCLSSFRKIADALKYNDYVASVHSLTENDITIGSAITFAESGTVIVYDSSVDALNSDYVIVEFADGAQMILPTWSAAQKRYNPLSKFKGKKLSIIGDSISTFDEYIPEGYATFYPSSKRAQKGTGALTKVEETWWYQLCEETGLTLLKNASWSGSWVTGDSKSTTNAKYACSTKRINDIAGDNGETPDIIICFIGINDLFNSNVAKRGVTLGSWTPDQEIPEEGKILEFSSAYALMLSKIISAYPNAKLFCCTLLTTGRSYKDTDGKEKFPTSHLSTTLNQVNNKIKEIANGIGCNVIDVHNCGINYFNIGSYTIDMTHPNADGATLIKNQILAELIAKY